MDNQTPEIPVQETPVIEQIPSASVGKQKILYATLGLILVAGMAFGAYWYGVQKIPSLPIPEPPMITEEVEESTTVMDDKVSSGCHTGFEYYNEEFFSICYPERLTLKERNVDPSFEEGNESVTVVFISEIGNERLLIQSDFVGGFGPAPCMTQEKVKLTISGYSATRYVILEDLDTGCGKITGLTSVVYSDVDNPYRLTLTGDYYENSDEFGIIEQSLEIKKP